ncbi:hypothetical protein HPB52_022224 [Rhipicephalus sanguineus]|uniref:Uncharacterized protein n=1 Tax=Rhipicephalus sanguineus TaxID=34632 RepID=A0A9D4TBT9_RHISA|nr:hypothetical protein HPB52_022224 [Rhipicephalus sanguineus]
MLQELILAEGSVCESGNEGVVGKPPSAKTTRDGTMPAGKSNRRPPSATKSLSGLDEIVKLEPERKQFKKEAVSTLSGRTRSKDSPKNGFCEESISMGLDNSTSTML